jgi:hypothetical protein
MSTDDVTHPITASTNFCPIQANFCHHETIVVLLDHVVHQLTALRSATVYMKVVYILEANAKDIVAFCLLYVAEGFRILEIQISPVHCGLLIRLLICWTVPLGSSFFWLFLCIGVYSTPVNF